MYTANLHLAFGNAGKSDMSLTFFIFPWHLLTVVTVSIIVTILFLAFALKRYNKWIIKQARQAAK